MQRARQQGCTMPLVMLTGNSGRQIDEAAIEAGADDYLVKGDVTAATLERSLRYAIERRAALNALQHREERLSALIANSADIIAMLDKHGRLTFISDAIERLDGRPASFFVGRSGLDHIDPLDHSKIKEVFARSLNEPGARICSDYRVRHADGSLRHREATFVNHLDNPAVEAIVVNSHDVTEKRIAASHQAYLAAIVESSDDAIFSRTSAGIITSWNAGAERLFGYTAAEIVGAHVSRLVTTTVARADMPAVFDRVARGEAIHQHECDCLRKDGRVVPVVLNISPLRQPDGTIVGASTMAHDITERRLVQAALIESESVYRSTFDEAPVGIAHTALDGRWMRVNARLRAMLNYSSEQLLATTLASLSHPDDGADDASARQQLLDGTISHYVKEKRYRRGGDDGGYVWVKITVSLHCDPAGEPMYFIVIVEDISGRKQARQELDHVFNLSPDMICTASFDGFLTRTNATWTTTLGYSEAELLGRPFIDFVHPEDQAATRRELSSLAAGTMRSGLTNRYRAADGSFRLLEWHAAVDPTTKVIYAVARDHTERRLLEDQLRQSQKIEAIGQLAGGVAHDFNNLLTAILGFSEMTMDQLGAEDPLRGDIQQIINAGQSAASLTRQLLAFSRKQILEPQILDVNGLVTSMQSLLRRVIGEHIELRTTLGDRMARIYADRGQIEQVVMNLAVNARDAMPLGGTFTIATTMCDIDEAFVAKHRGAVIGPHACVILSDDGTGMSREVLAHLFEPFFTTKPQGTGTGLGLATVYGIIKQSGGYIAVDSTPDVGTRFELYLPVAVTAAPIEIPSGSDASGTDGTETVLLAEDQKEVRDTASQALQRHGYRVLEAVDGFAALALAAEHHGRIDLLITDVVMPHMSGRELADRIGAIDRSIPILFTSGYTDDAIVRHGVL
ncbi:MAG TPA: PAS domain S-box protein, partial [Vicinamibacterales bacterium]|nr:PAS domain S-box protein [Vicinamibacterales bacterium]